MAIKTIPSNMGIKTIQTNTQKRAALNSSKQSTSPVDSRVKQATAGIIQLKLSSDKDLVGIKKRVEVLTDPKQAHFYMPINPNARAELDTAAKTTIDNLVIIATDTNCKEREFKLSGLTTILLKSFIFTIFGLIGLLYEYIQHIKQAQDDDKELILGGIDIPQALVQEGENQKIKDEFCEKYDAFLTALDKIDKETVHELWSDLSSGKDCTEKFNTLRKNLDDLTNKYMKLNSYLRELEKTHPQNKHNIVNLQKKLTAAREVILDLQKNLPILIDKIPRAEKDPDYIKNRLSHGPDTLMQDMFAAQLKKIQDDSTPSRQAKVIIGIDTVSTDKLMATLESYGLTPMQKLMILNSSHQGFFTPSTNSTSSDIIPRLQASEPKRFPKEKTYKALPLTEGSHIASTETQVYTITIDATTIKIEGTNRQKLSEVITENQSAKFIEQGILKLDQTLVIPRRSENILEDSHMDIVFSFEEAGPVREISGDFPSSARSASSESPTTDPGSPLSE